MSVDDDKRRAAAAALEAVTDGMRLGLGTGSTAAHFVTLLGDRVAAGLRVVGVPTSEATRALAERCGVPLTTLDDEPELDFAVDGADEVGPGLALIKGGGGALLREKIVAAASKRMIVIADAGKRVATLGAFPLPVEVAPFGLGATRRAVARAGAEAGCAGEIRLRGGADDRPFVTDGGHLILDAHFGRIADPGELARRLSAIPGVMEHGLFLGLATEAILAGAGGLVRLSPSSP